MFHPRRNFISIQMETRKRGHKNTEGKCLRKWWKPLISRSTYCIVPTEPSSFAPTAPTAVRTAPTAVRTYLLLYQVPTAAEVLYVLLHVRTETNTQGYEKLSPGGMMFHFRKKAFHKTPVLHRPQNQKKKKLGTFFAKYYWNRGLVKIIPTQGFSQ